MSFLSLDIFLETAVILFRESSLLITVDRFPVHVIISYPVPDAIARATVLLLSSYKIKLEPGTDTRSRSNDGSLIENKKGYDRELQAILEKSYIIERS